MVENLVAQLELLKVVPTVALLVVMSVDYLVDKLDLMMAYLTDSKMASVTAGM